MKIICSVMVLSLYALQIVICNLRSQSKNKATAMNKVGRITGAILHQYLLTKCFYYPHNKHGVDNFNLHSNLQFLREIPCDISWLSMPAFVRVIHLIEKIGQFNCQKVKTMWNHEEQFPFHSFRLNTVQDNT